MNPPLDSLILTIRDKNMAQSDVLKKLAQMDAKLLQHDDALRVIWRELQLLLNPLSALNSFVASCLRVR